MKICELCKKKPATIHLTNIENNVKKETHICEDCAKAKGNALQQAFGMPHLSFEAGTAPRPHEENEPELECEQCHMTWSEFRTQGRFGCQADYQAFRDRIGPLLRDIQSRETHHVGKTPTKGSAVAHKRRDLIACERRLREAVRSEDYETAAQLRDQLTALRNELKTSE